MLQLNPFDAIPCVDFDDLEHIDDKTLFSKAMSLSESRSKLFIDYFN